jgi:hypothetical protein
MDLVGLCACGFSPEIPAWGMFKFEYEGERLIVFKSHFLQFGFILSILETSIFQLQFSHFHFPLPLVEIPQSP